MFTLDTRGVFLKSHLNLSEFWRSFTTLSGDVREGFVEITRHSLALLGMAVVAVALTFFARPGLQVYASETLMSWLEMRQAETLDIDILLEGASRSTATSVKSLPKDQMAVTQWLSRKYKVSPEPVGALVSEAWSVGERSQIAPTLILAVMAIESNFHPYVQSPAGAQGLMQVMTDIHVKRYDAYGGRLAAFDPIANLRVGVAVLADFIKLRGGSVEDGLKFYLGGYDLTEDGGYVAKVFAEQAQLDRVAAGQSVPVQ